MCLFALSLLKFLPLVVEVELQQSVYPASETVGFVTVCAVITVGQLQGDVSVGLQSFVLSSDTASPGVHVVLLSA